MADEVAITGKPNMKVANLNAPTVTWDNGLKTMTVKASWKIPSNMTANTNPRRAENFSAWFGIHCTAPQISASANLKKFGGDYHYGSPAIVGANITSAEYTFDVSRFYPFNENGPRIISIYVYVNPYNSYGSPDWPGKAFASVNLLGPASTTTSDPELNDETGRISCTCKATATSGYSHFYSMGIFRDCYDSRTGQWGTRYINNSYVGTEYVDDVVDLSSIWDISGDAYWLYRINSFAKGICGNSGSDTSRRLFVSQPKVPTIRSVKVSGTNANSKVSVYLRANATEQHPVTNMRLQLLRSSPYKTAAQAEADADQVGWEDMSVVDNGQCTCLVTEVSEVRPDADTYTWVRVKTWNLTETQGNLHNWSKPVRLNALETKSPTASNDKCGIIDITPAKNGQSATVRMGWTEDTPNTGTELSWSESKTAWSATDGPSTSTFDGNGSASSGTGWARERTVTLSNLTPGTTYYVRIRRYLTASGSDTTYTAYSKTWSIKPQGAENDSCGIVSCKPGKDGTTATVVVGFTEDSTNTGTELTWSPDSNAWWSNVQPELLTATWTDSTRKSTDWQKTATIYLRGLDPNTTYYVRARRYLEASGSTTYSPRSKVGSFTTPPDSIDEVANDRVGIVSVSSGDDGTSADLVIGWSEDTAYDGTEVTWSDREDAWESTSQPSSFQATWADKKSQSQSWKATQTVHVEELEQGTKYWFRVRRYNSEGKSGWSNVVTVIPAVQPSSVTLVAPAFVERGRAVELSWTYGGGSEQTGWRIMSGSKVVASGDDPVTGCVVEASRIKRLTKNTSSIALRVEVSTGGDYVASDAITLGIADRPTMTVSDVDADEQPVSIPMSCSSENAYVTMVIMSMGATGSSPDGERTQAAGDTVWSGVVIPSWSGNGPYTSTVTIESGLDLWDGASYIVSAVATDTVTGLSSDAAYSYIDIDWDHKAAVPGEAVLTPYDSIDAEGNRLLGCTLALVAPDQYEAGDVCDVYRVTPDGAVLVASGVQFGTTIDDRYAMLGDASYRIATRTVDGDIDWLDFAYHLKCGSLLRIDWGSGYVELPYNLSWKDSYEKDFDAVKDLTGVTEGYWNSGVQHRQSLSTDVIKVKSAAVISSLRELGRYAGPAFVRTSDGNAYQANVTVSGIDTGYRSAAVSVSLDATEVALTNEFMVNIGG